MSAPSTPSLLELIVKGAAADDGGSGTIGVVIPPSVPMIIYAVIMLVIATSAVLSWTLSSWQVPGAIAQAVLSLSTDTYAIMLLVVVYVPILLGLSG